MRFSAKDWITWNLTVCVCVRVDTKKTDGFLMRETKKKNVEQSCVGSHFGDLWTIWLDRIAIFRYDHMMALLLLLIIIGQWCDC